MSGSRPLPLTPLPQHILGFVVTTTLSSTAWDTTFFSPNGGYDSYGLLSGANPEIFKRGRAATQIRGEGQLNFSDQGAPDFTAGRQSDHFSETQTENREFSFKNFS